MPFQFQYLQRPRYNVMDDITKAFQLYLQGQQVKSALETQDVNRQRLQQELGLGALRQQIADRFIQPQTVTTQTPNANAMPGAEDYADNPNIAQDPTPYIQALGPGAFDTKTTTTQPGLRELMMGASILDKNAAGAAGLMKPAGLIKTGRGDTIYNQETGQEVYRNPNTFPAEAATKAQSPLGKLMADRDLLATAGGTPEQLAAYDAAIKKATTVTTSGAVNPYNARAEGLFDKPFAELTKDQKLRVVQEVDKVKEAQLNLNVTNSNRTEAQRVTSNTAALRKEFENQSKEFRDVASVYNTAKNSPDTPAGNIALMYSFIKANDPGSRVTDNEFKVAARARPFLERAGLSWDAIKSAWQGQPISPTVRAQIIQSLEAQYKARLQSHQQLIGQYRGLAASNGLDPNQVIVDYIPKVPGKGGAGAAASPAAMSDDEYLKAVGLGGK